MNQGPEMPDVPPSESDDEIPGVVDTHCPL